MTKLRKPFCKPIYSKKQINKLFAGLGSVRIVKNYDLGLENAAFSRPRSQFFTIRTDPKPANNMYIHKTKQQKHLKRRKRYNLVNI